MKKFVLSIICLILCSFSGFCGGFPGGPSGQERPYVAADGSLRERMKHFRG